MIAEYPFVEAPYALVPLRPATAPVEGMGEPGTLADFFDERPSSARRSRRPMPRMYSVAQQRVRSRIEAARKCKNLDLKVERLTDAIDQAGVVQLPDLEIEKLNTYLQEQSGIAQARAERFPTPPPPDRDVPGLTEDTSKKAYADFDDENFDEPTEEEVERAATKIQSMHRGKKDRARVAQKREEKVEMDAAATKVQSVYRGQQARRRVSGMGTEENVEDAVQGQNKSEETFPTELGDDEELNGAATKVQCAFRGKKARNQVAKKKEDREMNIAATKVQSVYRGRAARQNLARAYAEGYGEIMQQEADMEYQPDEGEYLGEGGEEEGYENEDGYGDQGEGYEEEAYAEGQEGYGEEGQEGYYEGEDGEQYPYEGEDGQYYEGEPGEDGYVPAEGDYGDEEGYEMEP